MGFGQRLLEPFNASPLGAIFGLGAVIFGFAAACALYRGRLVDPLPEKLGWLSRAMRNRFYFDEFYENVLIPCTQEALAKVADAFDRWIIAGLGVRGAHGTTELVGRALRLRAGRQHSDLRLPVRGGPGGGPLSGSRRLNMSTLTYIIGWPLAMALLLCFVPRNYRFVMRIGGGRSRRSSPWSWR